MKRVDIVVPVYDGYLETVACLKSVLETVDPAWARLVVVNDCSPSREISDYLRRLASGAAPVVLLENDRNLGFVATANRGMAHDSSRDVLLLNSDVEVAGNWLTRLREAAYGNDLVGSVTPFSNNATICSFPDMCRDNQLPFGLDAGQIDETVAELFSSADVVDVPTGVGCCMYIRRDCLDQVGLFDLEAFGRGYGEENDWCQRAVALGWRNIHLANCFIFHKGGVSFQAEQNPRIERAMVLLDERYPDYHRRIQDFIARDPAKMYRIKALLALFARRQRPKIAFISHKLGGGAQQHVNELASLYQEQALFLQITPDVEGQTVTLTFFDGGRRLQDGLYFDIAREYGKLTGLLRELGIGHVHFHHTMGVPPRLWVLAQDLDCGYDLTIHDYYLINGNPTLTDAEARYVPEDSSDFDERCAGHYPLPAGIDADLWRQSQRILVENAARVIFPSEDCSRRFQRFYQVRQAVAAWHPDYGLSQPYPQPEWTYRGGRPLRVLVLGAISREKGADLLESIAIAMAGRDIEFHLLGYAYRALASSVRTHGPYANEDAYQLVADLKPDVVWFPALWPETYSYTLSIALHLGLPVVVPNIGAFVERVRERPLSLVRDWDSPLADWQEFWGRLLTGQEPGNIGSACAAASAVQLSNDFYSEEYLASVDPAVGELLSDTLSALDSNYHVAGRELSRSERILARIWKVSRMPLISRVVSIVPFRLQRAIKRRLSARAMHDIVGKP